MGTKSDTRSQTTLPTNWTLDSPRYIPTVHISRKDRCRLEDWSHLSSSKETVQYLPIIDQSLTTISCNILRHIIFNNIMSYFDTHYILTDFQHGFRENTFVKMKSFLLLTISLKPLKTTNKSMPSFLTSPWPLINPSPHSRLLQKLDHYGVTGSIHSWTQDFLCSHTAPNKFGRITCHYRSLTG